MSKCFLFLLPKLIVMFFSGNVTLAYLPPFFSYLTASMGLQVLWSFGLACLDIYALRKKRDLQNPILVSLFVVGDWVIESDHCFSYFHVEN